MPTSQHFVTGINPQTGGPSYRSMVYEAMVALPNTIIRPIDMVTLFPEHKAQAIKDALADIILFPEQYPGLHRVGLGQYKYDPSTPSVITKFPNMGRKSKGRRKVTVASAPLAPVPQEKVFSAKQNTPVKQDAPVKQDTPTFTATMPIFDRSSGAMVSTDNEVMLVDSQGRYWHAKRV